MDRKSAAVVMSWRTTGEIIKDSAVPRELGRWGPGGYDHRLLGRKRFAVEVDKEEREGRAGDSHPAVPSQFQECGEDDQEADAPRDEGEPLASPARIVRGAANQEHHAEQDRGPLEDRDEGDHAVGRSSAAEEKGTHEECETRSEERRVGKEWRYG